MRSLPLLAFAAVALIGCGGDRDGRADVFGENVAGATLGLCGGLSVEELGRALNTRPTLNAAKRQAAKRAVGAALIASETEFLTGKAERPSKSELRGAEQGARLLCKFAAEDLRNALREK